MCAVTSGEAREPDMVVWREGVCEANPRGSSWRKVVSVRGR